ncbi:MAG: ABC transporter permease [Azospirillaceae bacterium]
MLDGVVLERRQGVGRGRQAAVFAGSIALGLALSAGVLVAAGVPAGALFDEIVVQVFFTASGLAQTITMATPMVLLGLSAALALKHRFWNIGIEGQMILGAVAATAVAVGGVGGAGMRPAMMLIAAALAGLAWIAVPLVLKAVFEVSEVVVTLLLSSIAFLGLQHLLFGPMGDPARNFPVSPVIDEVARLPLFGFGDVHAGLVVALAAALAVAVLVDRSRPGFFGRFVGDNPSAARALGFPVVATTALFVLLSGALAGLAGGLVIAGTEHRLSQYVALHATFSGIVVAVLARYSALGCVVAAFFVAGVYVAGSTLKVFYGLPEGVILLVQGVVLLTLIGGQFLALFRVHREARPAPAPALPASTERAA